MRGRHHEVFSIEAMLDVKRLCKTVQVAKPLVTEQIYPNFMLFEILMQCTSGNSDGGRSFNVANLNFTLARKD